MTNVLKNIFTAKDNITYSLTKILGLSAGITMVVKFWQVAEPDYVGFGAGMAAIMAALAVKYYVEKENKDASENHKG